MFCMGDGMSLTEISDTITEADLAALEAGLAEHTAAKGVAPIAFRPLAALRRDASGKIVAGLYGKTFWDWLYVDTLWVHPDLRGQGVGRALMAIAEEEARRRGCGGIYLWTQTFDAPGFYQKIGFQQFVIMPDFPAGHQRYGFMRRLADR